MLIVGEKYRVLYDEPQCAKVFIGDTVTCYSVDDAGRGCMAMDVHGGKWWLKATDLEVINNPVIVEGNPLYHYRASEETGADAWSTLVAAVAHHVLWTDVKEQFKGWEEEYKVTTGLPVPGAWRSAKSVIKGAFNNAIPLMLNGEARGKTAVEKDIKAAKDSTVIMSPQEKLDKMMEKAFLHAGQHGLKFDASTSTGQWSA